MDAILGDGGTLDKLVFSHTGSSFSTADGLTTSETWDILEGLSTDTADGEG
jgi:hypothetical protein